MNMTKKIFCIAAAWYTCGSITYLHANASQPEQPTLQAEQEHEALEFLLKNVLKQLDDQDLLLEELSLVIDNNGLVVPNRRQTLETIKAYRVAVQQIKDGAYIDINPATVHMLSFVVQKVGKNLRRALATNFETFEEFDIESLIMRGFQDDVSLEDLYNHVVKNGTILEQLKVQTSQAGLTWYNKLYRTVDAYFIQPGQKHRFFSPAFPWIGPRTKLAFAAAGLVTYFAWRFADVDKPILKIGDDIPQTEEGIEIARKKKLNELATKEFTDLAMDAKERQTKEDEINAWADEELADLNSWIGKKLWIRYLKWIRRQFGYPIFTLNGRDIASKVHAGTQDEHGKQIQDDPRPYKAIGMIDHFFATNSPIGQWLLTLGTAAAASEWKNICEAMDKRATKVTNFLKGGVYKDRETENGRVIPKVVLSDLVGLEEVKEVFSMIVKYIEDPERFDRSKLDPERGFLLTGPTRTGKTFSAEALAGEIRAMYKRTGRNPDDFNFFVLSASFINQVGIDAILQEAQMLAPCILFIDEIDLLGLQRAGGNPEKLSQFLNSMSGCLQTNPSKPVIMIAATNRPENLDVALRQRGRFGKELRFEYPSLKNRKEFLMGKLDRLSAGVASFDVNRLAHETENCSYEDLKAIIRSSFLDAKIHGQTLLQEHIDRAIDKEIRLIIFHSNQTLSENEQRLVAAHIAGHALATTLLLNDERISRATILPYQTKLREVSAWDSMYHTKETEQKKIEHGHLFTYNLYDTRNLRSRQYLRARIKTTLAGFAAEQIMLGSPSGYTYHKEDATVAYEIAKALATDGLNIDHFTDNLKTEYLRKALELKNECEQEIFQLLEQHKPALEALTTALLHKKIISGDEITAIIKKAEKELTT